MKDTNNIWLLVGRETEGNNIKNYILMDYNGCTQFVQKRSIVKFCREHEVINVQLSGDSITGKGIAITALPRYTKQQGFGLQQVSGMSQAEVIQMAQPLINQYMQRKEAAQQRKEANSQESQKAKQNEYVVNKLIIIEDLIVTALAMKDITNELASSEHITRYIKQIDIDNAEGDSLDNLIRRNGVNGLANGLLDRLDKIKVRIQKYNLDRNYGVQADKLKGLCDELKKAHSETKDIIKNNKMQDNKQISLLKEPDTELDDIPIVEDTTDMICVDMYEDEIPVVEDIGSDGTAVEQCDSYDISAIEDIFSKPEETAEEKLNINDVISELFFSNDGYKTNKNNSNVDVIEDYRTWDNYGFKAVTFITTLYYHKDNKFRVTINIPPISQVRGFTVSKAEFPGNYAIKINRDNINKAKEVLQNYIDSTLIYYREADEILYSTINAIKALNKDIKGLNNNLDTIYKIFMNQEIATAESPDDFIRYINLSNNNLLDNMRETYNNVVKYNIIITDAHLFKKYAEELESKLDKLCKKLKSKIYEYHTQLERNARKFEEEQAIYSNINNIARDIGEEAKFKAFTIDDMMAALEKIDIQFYYSKLENLSEGNLVVRLYEPVIDYLKKCIGNLITEYDNQLGRAIDIIESSESIIDTKASTSEINEALKQFSDI